MLLKSPPLQNELFHQPSSKAPSSGPRKNKSVSPLLASLLHREAQKGKPMSPPPCDLPCWAPFMLLRALDTQAASVLSRSSKLATGGPVWPGMSANLSTDAESVPSLHHLPDGKLVPLSLPVVRGPTSESTLPRIIPTLMNSHAF